MKTSTVCHTVKCHLTTHNSNAKLTFLVPFIESSTMLHTFPSFLIETYENTQTSKIYCLHCTKNI